MAKVTRAEVTHFGEDYGVITITEFTPGKLDSETREYEVDKSLAVKLQKALKELKSPAKF
jgi:hypothetical protein